jgi:transcriptional regulator with XRE-family HTH domain
MKRNYVPTEADRQTGANLRELRKRRGETLAETTEQSGFGRDRSTLAATERGERRLTEIEATKLAAHFGTTVDRIFVTPKRPALLPAWAPATEQDWLGNTAPTFAEIQTTTPTALFPLKPAVPELLGASAVEIGRTITIDLDSPLTPDAYRAQVWIPYLENRYNAEQKAS